MHGDPVSSDPAWVFGLKAKRANPAIRVGVGKLTIATGRNGMTTVRRLVELGAEGEGTKWSPEDN